MKKKKAMIMSGIASVLAAVIIYVSGGQVIFAALLGGAGLCTIPSAIYIKETEKNITQIEEKIILEKSSEISKINTNEVVKISPIKQYDDIVIPELITIDALTQKEKNLVRTRKKETEEILKQQNNLKNNKK